jgi:hypothetical protein
MAFSFNKSHLSKNHALVIFSTAWAYLSFENSKLITLQSFFSTADASQIVEYPFAVPISSIFFAFDNIIKSYKNLADV